MDAIYSAVFEKILSACSGGGYAIIDSGEFFDAFPEDGRKTTGELDNALKFLQKNGCIDVKYARGDVYCICALKNCLPEERQISEPCTTVIEVNEKINRKRLAIYTVSAFLGGAAGSFIACILAAVI